MAKKNEDRISGYSLARAWFDFSFENQDILTPAHTAMFLWFIELNNRLGWVEKFACPASQTMAAISIKSFNTYKKVFRDLVDFGVVKVITESKNQYTACIIALSNFDKAHDKALDNAVTKHLTTQVNSTVQSIDSINKQVDIINISTKPINQERGENRNAATAAPPILNESISSVPVDEKEEDKEKSCAKKESIPKPTPVAIPQRKDRFREQISEYKETYTSDMLNAFYRYWTEMNDGGKKMRFEMEKVFEVGKRLSTWFEKDKKFIRNEQTHQRGNPLRPNGIEPPKNISTYGKL